MNPLWWIPIGLAGLIVLALAFVGAWVILSYTKGNWEL